MCRAFLLLFLAGALRAERFKVASWNVENYNLTGRMTDGVRRQDYPKSEQAKARLRLVIRAMDADVLALQEMGGPAFVEELRRDLETEGLRYPHAVCLEGPDPDRRTAILAKRPFAAVRREPRIETGFALPSPRETVALVNRGLLGVTVRAAGHDVAIVTIHLKSRLTRDPRDPRGEGERRAEAAAIRARLSPAGFLLLCGDFNDGPAAAATSLFARDFLLRLDPADAAGETWTYRNDRKGPMNRSDYLFVSPALRPRVIRTAVIDSPSVRLASDHRPLLTVFELPP